VSSAREYLRDQTNKFEVKNLSLKQLNDSCSLNPLKDEYLNSLKFANWEDESLVLYFQTATNSNNTMLVLEKQTGAWCNFDVSALNEEESIAFSIKNSLVYFNSLK
jgi:hypothetical protein